MFYLDWFEKSTWQIHKCDTCMCFLWLYVWLRSNKLSHENKDEAQVSFRITLNFCDAQTKPHTERKRVSEGKEEMDTRNGSERERESARMKNGISLTRIIIISSYIWHCPMTSMRGQSWSKQTQHNRCWFFFFQFDFFCL